MRVFVTGASGFVGTAVVKELISKGHTVLGLARSDASAQKLEAGGAEVFRGSLEDTDGLKKAAAETDGVIHCGFIHDFSNMAHSGKVDYAAITAMGEVLAGTGKPLVITSGIGLLKPGHVGTENDMPASNGAGSYRAPSEVLSVELASKGVRSSTVRLSPSVHGAGDYGFVPFLMKLAKEKGAAAYIGDGSNRWPGVALEDAASLFVLAVEKGKAGSRYHGVGEEGVPFKVIAEAIGKRLDLPVISVPKEQAAEHFGWMAHFAGIDVPASNEITKKDLGWSPKGISLVEDIAKY